MSINMTGHRYSSSSAHLKLSNEYQQHGKVLMVFKNRCIPVLWPKVAFAKEGLSCDMAKKDDA